MGSTNPLGNGSWQDRARGPLEVTRRRSRGLNLTGMLSRDEVVARYEMRRAVIDRIEVGPA